MPKVGPIEGLAQRDHGLLADVAHRLAQPDRRRRLALAERRRRDRGHDDVLRRWAVAELLDRVQLDLGDVGAVRLQQVLADAHRGGHLRDRLR